MAASRIQICSPIGHQRDIPGETMIVRGPERRRAPGVAGSTVAFRVQWESFDTFMERVETNLRDRFGVTEVNWWKLPKLPDWSRASQLAEFDRQLTDIVSRSDWTIAGLAA